MSLMSGARGTLVLPHASAARGDAAPPLEGGTTPQTLRASGGDSAAAPTVQQQAVEVHPTTQGQLQATPLHRAAPSRWANAASAARAAVTPLPGGAFRESATIRASFWLCRGCDVAWPREGAAADVCPTCHVPREDMQLQAGATERAQVRAIVEADSYGRSLGFANSTEQPIGPPPAFYANPNAEGFAESVRSAAIGMVAGITLNGGRTDAIMTFESWLLLMYDAEFSV